MSTNPIFGLLKKMVGPTASWLVRFYPVTVSNVKM